MKQQFVTVLITSFLFLSIQQGNSQTLSEKELRQCLALLGWENLTLSRNVSDGTTKILDGSGLPTSFQCKDLLDERVKLTHDERLACINGVNDNGYFFSSSSEVDEIGIVQLRDGNSTTLLCENLVPSIRYNGSSFIDGIDQNIMEKQQAEDAARLSSNNFPTETSNMTVLNGTSR